jgi:hypothetical protein
MFVRLRLRSSAGLAVILAVITVDARRPDSADGELGQPMWATRENRFGPA